MVGLETRAVVGNRKRQTSFSQTSIIGATRLGARPGVEFVRDRHGFCFEGARNGSPKVLQVADRFLMVQNHPEAIVKQLGRLGRTARRHAPAAIKEDETQAARRRRTRQAQFEPAHALYGIGKTEAATTQQFGLSRNRVDKCICLKVLPPRNAMTLKPISPAYCEDNLARRWADGYKVAQCLLTEINNLGFKQCHNCFARVIRSWRWSENQIKSKQEIALPGLSARDPATARQISFQTASISRMKPWQQLTACQAIIVDAFKEGSQGFKKRPITAIRSPGLSRGRGLIKRDNGPNDTYYPGVFYQKRFLRKVQNDLAALRHAVTEPWSNVHTEGEIRRRKTLKRGTRLRLRTLPIRDPMAAKACTPAFYKTYPGGRGAEDYRGGRGFFEEIRCLGFTGCLSQSARIARIVSARRHETKSSIRLVSIPTRVCAPDIRAIRQNTSPLVGAALCMEPRSLMTARRTDEVNALERDTPDFTTIRQIEMNFRISCVAVILKSGAAGAESLKQSGNDFIKRFAKQIGCVIAAVRVAVTKIWNNGPTEGQINCRNTLKRSMSGGARTDRLRARLLPPFDDRFAPRFREGKYLAITLTVRDTENRHALD